MNNSAKYPKPTLIMVRGLPGSGKSYMSKELVDYLGSDTGVILDPDTVDYDSNEYIKMSSELSNQGVDAKLHPYRYLRSKAYEAISSQKIIIWTQAFTNADLLHRTIVNLKSYASEHGLLLKVLVVEVKIDPKVAKERVRNRVEQGGNDVPKDEFERFINSFEPFSDYDYPMISVDGSQAITASAQEVLRAIEKLSD